MKTCFLLILYSFASYFVGCEELSENQNHGHKEIKLPTLSVSEQQRSNTVEYQSNKVPPAIIKDVTKPNVESASVLNQLGGKQNVTVAENKGTKEIKQEQGQTESRIKEVQSQIEKKKEEIKQQSSQFIAGLDKTLPVVNNNNSLDKHLTVKTDIVNNNDGGWEDLNKPGVRHGNNHVTTKLQETRLPQTVSTINSLSTKPNRVFKTVEIASLHPVSSTPYPGDRPALRPVSSTPYPGDRPTSRPVSSTPYPGDRPTSRPVSSTTYSGDRPMSRLVSNTPYPGERRTLHPVSSTPYPGDRPTLHPVSSTTYPEERQTLRPVSSSPYPGDRPTLRPVSSTPYPDDKLKLRSVSSATYPGDKSKLRSVSSTTYPGDKSKLRSVTSTTYPGDRPTLRPVSSTTYPRDRPTLRPVYSKLHPETPSPNNRSEDAVDNGKDLMINWDRNEEEDTYQDEVIPLDDDEDQWDGDNNVNLKVDEDENDAFWEDEKENTDNVEDKMDDFVDGKDNVEGDKGVYGDDEDDFNSIADKTGDFWDESSYNKNPFIRDKFVTKNFKSPFAEEMKMMGFYSWVLFVTVLLLIVFVFFTQQRHRCGKLTGFHHRYKRPSVSSEEGKGLMKNMYA